MRICVHVIDLQWANQIIKNVHSNEADEFIPYSNEADGVKNRGKIFYKTMILPSSTKICFPNLKNPTD